MATAGLIVSLAVAAANPCASLASVVPPDLVYFQGKWSITIKSDPSTSYTWTVSQDLKGEWLMGVVEKSDERITTDLWRLNAGIIERYVFTNDGVFIKLVSSGWKSGKMVLNGIANGKAVDYRVRETITKESEKRFRAIWERQGDDGKWTVYSEEVCAK